MQTTHFQRIIPIFRIFRPTNVRIHVRWSIIGQINNNKVQKTKLNNNGKELTFKDEFWKLIANISETELDDIQCMYTYCTCTVHIARGQNLYRIILPSTQNQNKNTLYKATGNPKKDRSKCPNSSHGTGTIWLQLYRWNIPPAVECAQKSNCLQKTKMTMFIWAAGQMLFAVQLLLG